MRAPGALRLAAVAAAAALVATGCGYGESTSNKVNNAAENPDNGQSQTQKGPPVHQKTVSSTVPSTPTVPPTTLASPAVPDDAALRSALLEAGDGEAKWVEATKPAITLSNVPSCMQSVVNPSGAAGDASVTYLNGPGGMPIFVENLTSWPGTQAASVFAQDKAALDNCHSVSVEANGSPVSATVSSAGRLPIGDESAAYQASAASRPLHVNAAIVRQKGILVAVAYITNSSSDPSMLDTLARRAVDKLALIGINQ